MVGAAAAAQLMCATLV